MFHMVPEAIIAVTTFGKKAVNVRIPFKISAEGMENHDIAGSEIFGMIELGKHS